MTQYGRQTFMADFPLYQRAVDAIQTAKDFAVEEVGPESESVLAKLLALGQERRPMPRMTDEQVRRLVLQQAQTGATPPSKAPGQTWTRPLSNAMESVAQRWASPYVSAVETAQSGLEKGGALWNEHGAPLQEELAKVLLLGWEPRQTPPLTEEQTRALVRQQALSNALRRQRTGSGD